MKSARPAPPDPRRCALIVFAREPAVGEVKTRLAAQIGALPALRIYRRLLARTFALARRYAERRGVTVILAGEGRSGCDELARRAARHGFAWRVQRRGDLGARMHEAFSDAFAAGFERVVLIGCDCPVMGARDLDRAFTALAEATAAFAPAEDGGYALVALTRPVAALFQGISWGGVQVFAQTREAATRAGIPLRVLAQVWDVDRLPDLRRWEAQRARRAAARRAPGTVRLK